MKILFTHSYFLRFDPKQWETGQPYPPLGTLYAAALARHHGHEVFFFDNMFSHDAAEITASINTVQPDLLVIYDDGFNYLTKMCLTNMREAAFNMIEIARGKNVKVIISSSDSTDHYAQYLDKGADFVLIGEGEMTLMELIEGIVNGRTDFDATRGVAVLKDGVATKTPRREVMRDLDSLPAPAWDLLNAEPYKTMWMKGTGYFSLNIGTTRGCPFKCNWCAKPIYGNRYNSRSPQNVVSEIVFLVDRFQCSHIWFCDDIFGLKPGWVEEFARLMKERGLKIKFKIQSRADLLLQENYVKALAEAGCENVWIGAESGSQKILDAMDKGITTGQIGEATALLKKHSIHPSFFIQFGYLGETKEDIIMTISMINKLLPSSIGVSVSYPLPGTVFYEKVKADLTKKANWTDSDELKLMFRNTYQPAFYKHLHRYAQRNHRMHLAYDTMKRILKNPASISPRTVKKAASLAYYIPAVYFDKLKLNSLEKPLAE